ncbi:MAG: DNA repair protein RecO [Chitinispirillales bacterium]|jgi:DNA repair protein RecO|nr:DNA repair protein RecO [Chitinispirillales bacterium]
MSAEKSESVILSVAPYRETSCIMRLFTRAHGLVHGMAKGARRSGKPAAAPLDRGFLLEAVVYYRPNRELHTLGGLHVTNFFPNIRSSITKSAVRDIALELYLKSITLSEPHPELFELIVDFLAETDGAASSNALFPALWRFISDYCRLAGFGIDAQSCKASGIDSGVVKIVDETINAGLTGAVDKSVSFRVTEQLLSYCRRHFDMRGGFNSLEFLRLMCT